MDCLLLNQEIENYINDLKNTKEYKELKKLYDLILDKYKDLVLAFTSAKRELEKGLEYGDYYPGLKDLKLKYQEAKSNLYSKPELKEYFSLISEVEKLANGTIDEIKSEII